MKPNRRTASGLNVPGLDQEQVARALHSRPPEIVPPAPKKRPGILKRLAAAVVMLGLWFAVLAATAAFVKASVVLWLVVWCAEFWSGLL